MKAKKTSPKSVRFNLKDFEAGMLKGNFESAQDMVDYLLKNYVQPQNNLFKGTDLSLITPAFDCACTS